LAHTDELCAGVAARDGGLEHLLFAVTYCTIRVVGDGRAAAELPATTLIQTTAHAVWGEGERRPPAGALMAAAANSPGALWIAAHWIPAADRTLLRDIILGCLASRRYHLQLKGMALADDLASVFDDNGRRTVADAIRANPAGGGPGGEIFAVEALASLGELSPHETAFDEAVAEIGAVLAAPQHPGTPAAAYRIISMTLEHDRVSGPYEQALLDLSDTDRHRLDALALLGTGPDSLYVDYLVRRFEKLTDPLVRVAMSRVVETSDPKQWYMADRGMSAVVEALALLAADGAAPPDPDPLIGGSRDPAWRACLAVIHGAVADHAKAPVDAAALEAAWAALSGEHRDVLASLIASLASVEASRWPEDTGVHAHRLVVDSMPDAAVDTLIWALEHPQQQRHLGPRGESSIGSVIDALGRRGGPAAAGVLRRFADDSAYAEAAASAVREIETRDDGPLQPD
jgi:hypothetical protein